MYATIDDFKEYVFDWNEEGVYGDDRLAVLLREAEKDIDDAVGGVPLNSDTGQKFILDDGSLWNWQIACLRDAVCAQMEYRIEMGPDFFRSNKAKQVSGPDRNVQVDNTYLGPKARRELTRGKLFRLTTGQGRRPYNWLPRA